MMSGNSVLAASAAAALEQYVNSLNRPLEGTEQHYVVLPLYVRVRFGNWQAIVEATRPPGGTPYTDGVWHYARGMALVRAHSLERARSELVALQDLRRTALRDDVMVKNAHRLSTLLELCARLLQAELEAASGNAAAAIGHARSAVQIERALERDEPPVWAMPARHVLGALLLENGRVREAERVYRQDLAVYRANGWALAGLGASLARQGRTHAAEQTRARQKEAWSGDDIIGSRF